jgi:hypothetical protein
MTSNEIAGSVVHGNIIQAANIEGDVTITAGGVQITVGETDRAPSGGQAVNVLRGSVVHGLVVQAANVTAGSPTRPSPTDGPAEDNPGHVGDNTRTDSQAHGSCPGTTT